MDLQGGSGSVEVEGLEIKDYVDQGILVSGPYAGAVAVKACVLMRNGSGTGPGSFPRGGVVVHCTTSGIVEDCTVRYGAGYGTGILIDLCAQHSGHTWGIIDNFVSHHYGGITTNAPGLISGNVCEDITYTGLYVMCRDPGYYVDSNRFVAKGDDGSPLYASLDDWGAELDLANNVFASPSYGSCIWNTSWDTSCLIRNNTFYVGNGSQGYRGALYLESYSSAVTEVTSNIFVSGSGTALALDQLGAGWVSGHNDIYSYSSGGANLRCDSTNYTSLDNWRANCAPNDDSSFSADPLFAHLSFRDFHLRSQGGRWDPAGGGTWVVDAVTSPCIDAGDPAQPVGDELPYNGDRINVGAYGGTRFASRSAIPPAPGEFSLLSPYAEEREVAPAAALDWEDAPFADTYAVIVSPNSAFTVPVVQQAGLTDSDFAIAPGDGCASRGMFR